MAAKRDVIDFCKEAATRGKAIKQVPKAGSNPDQIRQVIKSGSNNAQINGDNNTVIIGKAGARVKVQPSPNSIGGSPDLKTAIIERFNKLGDERSKRFGQTAFPAMYKKFKSDFGIKNGAWTIIWNWPVERAGAILSYLDALYDNTIQGRKEKAARKEGYIPSKPHLFKRETELLQYLGYTTKSPEIRQLLQEQFRVTSHAQLTQVQLWQLVCHLEGLVKRMVGE